MSIADEIEKLHRLKESGVINESDFQQAKARLLNGEHSDPLQQRSPPSARSLHGIGGWLLFFCIVLTFVIPVVSLAHVFDLVKTAQIYKLDAPDNYIVFTALFAAYSLYVGVNLWRITPSALQKAKTFLVIAAFAPLGATVALQTDEFTPLQTALLTNVWKSIIPGIASSIMWYQYLKRSRRVSNTYPRANGISSP